MIEIPTSDMPNVLDRSAKSGNKKPPLFLAAYGIGKSQSSVEWAKANNREYVDIRLAYYTFNDVRGFGVPDYEHDTMRFLHSEDFPRNPDGSYLIHWEELTNCMPATQKVALQGILDRRIGKYVFPKDSVMMASGNRLKDKTYAERLAAALADRFAIYKVRPDLSSFLKYMEDNFQSAYVYSYIQGNPSAPYDFDIGKWDGESNFPTFRSIERLDELVNSYSSSDELLNDRLLAAHAEAYIGPKHGRMFAEYVKLTAAVGSVEDLINNADTCKIPDRPDLCWMVACKMISLATPDNVANCLKLAHRLTDPTMSDPDTLQSMESFFGGNIRRRRTDILRTAPMIGWITKHSKQLTSF